MLSLVLLLCSYRRKNPDSDSPLVTPAATPPPESPRAQEAAQAVPQDLVSAAVAALQPNGNIHPEIFRSAREPLLADYPPLSGGYLPEGFGAPEPANPAAAVREASASPAAGDAHGEVLAVRGLDLHGPASESPAVSPEAGFRVPEGYRPAAPPGLQGFGDAAYTAGQPPPGFYFGHPGMPQPGMPQPGGPRSGLPQFPGGYTGASGGYSAAVSEPPAQQPPERPALGTFSSLLADEEEPPQPPPAAAGGGFGGGYGFGFGGLGGGAFPALQLQGGSEPGGSYQEASGYRQEGLPLATHPTHPAHQYAEQEPSQGREFSSLPPLAAPIGLRPGSGDLFAPAPLRLQPLVRRVGSGGLPPGYAASGAERFPESFPPVETGVPKGSAEGFGGSLYAIPAAPSVPESQAAEVSPAAPTEPEGERLLGRRRNFISVTLAAEGNGSFVTWRLLKVQLVSQSRRPHLALSL